MTGSGNRARDFPDLVNCGGRTGLRLEAFAVADKRRGAILRVALERMGRNGP
jgi:hypothetical protein